ncbi:PH domain-containing protein [Natronoglycomyces albus]|uniref:PH domain-containing protein n=1 Tax=Natronoglycomyces albus TaxID=2811108 RepID=A0A895XIF7_9ACTN|nr:PH domain-containing protein [Natronoglycomyces albus]QSB04737.1 PH domain-containing protein [Natronoglycomyces albus]
MTDAGAGGPAERNTEPLTPPHPRASTDGSESVIGGSGSSGDPAPQSGSAENSPSAQQSGAPVTFSPGTSSGGPPSPESGGLPETAQSILGGVRFSEAGMLSGLKAPRVPDAPSPISARYLFPTEKYRGEWRRHWVHLMPWCILGALSTFIMGFVSGLFLKWESDSRELALSITFITWAIVLGYVGWKLIDWYMDRFILTNKRVMLINGVVTRKVAMMPLMRVTDMKYEQTPMGRMLNYGTFIIESAGQDQALREIAHLPNPNELYLQICEEMYEPEAVDERDSEEEVEIEPESSSRRDARTGGDA